MDVNTHPEKCGDFYFSVVAIYYHEIEKINDYERNIVCKPELLIDQYHPWVMKIESVTWMEVTKKYKKKSCYINVMIVIDLELRNLEGYNN